MECPFCLMIELDKIICNFIYPYLLRVHSAQCTVHCRNVRYVVCRMEMRFYAISGRKEEKKSILVNQLGLVRYDLRREKARGAGGGEGVPWLWASPAVSPAVVSVPQTLELYCPKTGTVF